MARKKSGDIAPAVRVPVDANLVAGFTETFLQDDYDNPKPSPEFHRTMWDLFCSDVPYAAVAAPRGHAKSTAGTLAFGLACLLFGSDDFCLVVSATEALASMHVHSMTQILEENEDLQVEFDVEVLRANDTKLVARVGGRTFCVIGKGAEQSVRGTKWRHKRPSLILVDDLEEDEAVMSKERRTKLREWFQNALLPCGADTLRVRFVGTILHLDSLLERLLANDQWKSRRFRAHKSFDDFTEILWPEKFPEERLRFIRETYLSEGNASGYSQEYLSQAIAEADSFFRKTDFHPMVDSDHTSPKTYYAAVEFALGEGDKGDNTVIVVGGMDPEGILHVVYCEAGRMDPLYAIERIFEVQEQFDIYEWVVEDDNISKAIGPFLNQEMVKRGTFLALHRIRPHKDKQRRAVSIKSRMRAGGVRFDFDADWYPALQQELVNFPRGKHDDRVDALAWLGLRLDALLPSLTRKELDRLAWEEEVEETSEDGRNSITGY